MQEGPSSKQGGRKEGKIKDEKLEKQIKVKVSTRSFEPVPPSIILAGLHVQKEKTKHPLVTSVS